MTLRIFLSYTRHDLRVARIAYDTGEECWKHRLQVLKKDLGYDEMPLLEKLLIQQAALCLAEAESRGIDLLRHHVTVNYLDAGYVLGKTVECRAEAVHASL
jgi:hypothetical protein